MLLSGCINSHQKTVIYLNPVPTEIMTSTIQLAIDSCADAGGGIIHFSKGKYISGGIHLKSNVTLKLEKGAILQSSDQLKDFGDWKWTTALIMGENLKDVAIVGEGTLDGIDLYNPQGEGGRRGPHGIRLTNCDGILIEGITIERSANWAMNFRHCGFGKVQNVKVKGGHDAFHTRFCRDFEVLDCDFRTGDDCIAGNDNRDFKVKNCNLNTSCNAFRFGCLNLEVKDCNIWGPGEYPHISQNRNNTLSAFVHFSPKDEHPKIVSGNWLIQDVSIDHVDNIYIYNFKDGLWQTGQPATNIVFKNLKATNVKKAFTVVGDSARSLNLTIDSSLISERDNTDFTNMIFEGRDMEVPGFLNAKYFESIGLHDVTIKTNSSKIVIAAENGTKVFMDKVKYFPQNNSNQFRNISEEVASN